MQNLIPVVNKLQDAFAKLGTSCPIDLPQIAVVGGQSAGKSSVLENCVGKDFLPRGSGIVTRRPLVLQLIQKNCTEYAEFLHKPNAKFTDFAQVRSEIEQETDRVTGKNKNISPLPINLRIYSPNVLNLTLVDLPGLTKIAVGDQPQDIGEQIKNMVVEFVSNPNCLILAVTPANIDIANSDALLLARSVDPQGLRTIGVITKIDLMDRGTNCRDVLLNITYPLKRGYVGIVNRSQADIDGQMDIQKAQQAERAYFLSQKDYRDIATKCGTRYLQEVLNQQLTNHIKTTLPTLKENVMSQLISLEKDLGDFDESNETSQGKAKLLMMLVQSFNREIEESLGFRSESVKIETLSVGAHINKLLTERFPYEMRKLKTSPNELRNEIKFAIMNAQGVKTSIFTPDLAFTTVVRKKLEDIRPIAIMIITKIMAQLRIVIEEACVNSMSKYMNLLDEVKMIVLKELMKLESKVKKQMNLMIDFESSYINTTHPDFVKLTFGEYGQPVPDEGEDGEEAPKLLDVSSQNKVLRKGYMVLSLGSGILKNSKDYYFILKGRSLFMYKDESTKELKQNIDLSNCFIKNSKKHSFQILKKDGTQFFKDLKFVDLTCSSDEECEDWKASLMAIGVFPEKEKDKPEKPIKSYASNNELNKYESGKSKEEKDFGHSEDPVLFRQVETIRFLTESYLKIIIKQQTDLTAKIIVSVVINRIRHFTQSELVAHLYSNGSVEDYLQESQDEVQRKLEMVKIKDSCSEALKIINDVMSSSTTIIEKSIPDDSVRITGSPSDLRTNRNEPTISKSTDSLKADNIRDRNYSTSVSAQRARKLPPRPLNRG